MNAPARGGARGSVLVEALVALVLIALAGLLVASAATAGLRATSRAATLTRTTALAARELALLANQAATAASERTTFTVPGFADPVARASDVWRDGDVVAVTIRLDAGRPAERVTLATRVLVDP